MKKLYLSIILPFCFLNAIAAGHIQKPSLCNDWWGAIPVEITDLDPAHAFKYIKADGKIVWGQPSNPLENQTTRFDVCANTTITYQAPNGAYYKFIIGKKSCDYYVDDYGPDKLIVNQCYSNFDQGTLASYTICNYRDCSNAKKLA